MTRWLVPALLAALLLAGFASLLAGTVWLTPGQAFAGLFANAWLWGAVALALALQVAVVYTPFLQKAFSTVALAPRDWLICAATGSSGLWLTEMGKALLRSSRPGRAAAAPRDR